MLDRGFVELLDVMGDDLEPARAARVSYGQGERGWDEGDGKLTRYLIANGHTSPFEMVELKFRVRAPIFVARQWVRHRTANWNEFSMRYADPARLADGEEIDYYTPDVWRLQDRVNLQGSHGALPEIDQAYLADSYRQNAEADIRLYRAAVGAGVSKELARICLPVSVYTEWVWKNDLRNTMHFWNLRVDEHAQWEMRQYAEAMVLLVEARLPNLVGLWRERFEAR